MNCVVNGIDDVAFIVFTALKYEEFACSEDFEGFSTISKILSYFTQEIIYILTLFSRRTMRKAEDISHDNRFV